VPGLMAEGRSNAAIAAELAVTERASRSTTSIFAARPHARRRGPPPRARGPAVPAGADANVRARTVPRHPVRPEVAHAGCGLLLRRMRRIALRLRAAASPCPPPRARLRRPPDGLRPDHGGVEPTACASSRSRARAGGNPAAVATARSRLPQDGTSSRPVAGTLHVDPGADAQENGAPSRPDDRGRA
jgi:hypothetical protein